MNIGASPELAKLPASTIGVVAAGLPGVNQDRAYQNSSPRESFSEGTMNNRRVSHARHFQSRGGNILPRVSTNEVTQGQADVLQAVYVPLKKPADALAEDAGTCTRSARNHLSGANAMNLTDFFNACRAIPELRAWGAKMMGMEADFDPRFQEDLAKFIRAAQQTLSQRGGE